MKYRYIYIILLILQTTCLQGMPSPYIIARMSIYVFNIFITTQVYPPCLQVCIQEEPSEIVIKTILNSTAQELNTRDNNGNTCLHYLCGNHDPLIIALITKCIAQGAIPSLTNYIGNTPLHDACNTRNYKATQVLLDNNVPVDYQNTHGLTPLFCTLINADYDIAQLLIQYKAHTELRNNKNETPLFYACQHGMLPFVNLLLRAGANPNSTCNGTTAHFYLAQKKHYNTIVMQNRLLEYGALITNSTIEGDDPCSLLQNSVPKNFKNYEDEKTLILKRLIALHNTITQNKNHIFWQALQKAYLSEKQLHALCNHALYIKKPEIKNTIYALYLKKHTYPLPYRPDIIIMTAQ